MSTDNYTSTISKDARCEERRRPVKYLRIPRGRYIGMDSFKSYFPLSGMMIARTAKGLLPALLRAGNTKYAPHVGNKQREKMLGIYRTNLSDLS